MDPQIGIVAIGGILLGGLLVISYIGSHIEYQFTYRKYRKLYRF